MIDGWQTTDIALCGALLYAFGEESLVEIEIDDTGRAIFHLAIPSLDAEETQREFDSVEGLAISNLKSYMRTFSWLSRLLRKMKRDGATCWTPRRYSRRAV